MAEVDKKKRKKKRSHIQMAKKFARQRNFGDNLDQDTYQYLIRILEIIRKERSSKEAYEENMILAQNVYQEITGRETECACNQVGSLVIDSLLKYANLNTIQKLIQAFEPALRRLSTDRYASHILQKIIMICADRGNRIPTSNTQNAADKNIELEDIDTVDIKPSEIQCYNNIVLKVSRYVLNNSEEFVFDTYANYVLRTVIECLGGLIQHSNEQNKKFVITDLAKRRPVIQEYKDLLIQSCDRLQKWPQFHQFGRDQMTSGLIQCVLYSLKDIDSSLVETIIKKITTECFKTNEGNQLSNIFNEEYSIRILEACLIVAQPDTFDKLYKTLFAENLKNLCLMQYANFSVQKLIDYCTSKEIFEEIFDKVTEQFEQILKQGFTGILVSIGNACLKLQIKQGPFVNAIIKVLKCDDTENQSQLIRCIVTLKKPSELKNESNNLFLPFHLHGSLIIQIILKFNKPIKVVRHLLEMSNEELLQLFTDQKGSRILDAFMDSNYIGEKSKEKLYKKLQGTWVELAKSTYGSRCVDKMWTYISINKKIHIMEELATAGESLRSTKSGKIIFTKLDIPLFMKNKKEWTQSQGKNEKIKALFTDIIEKPINK